MTPLKMQTALLLGALLSLCPATLAGGDVTVMLTKGEALAAVFPTADRVLELRHILTSAETASIEKVIRHDLDEGGFYLYRATRGETLVGHAVVVSQIGKVRPITHMVGVTPAGEVGTVAVMIYRESHGHEIANERFMDQYRGKGLGDPIRIGRDIINVAGATLSGNAICRGVRKALGVTHVLFTDADPDTLAERLAAATDVTPDVLAQQRDMPLSAGEALSPATARSAVAAVNPASSALDVEIDGSVRVERRVMGTLCTVQAYADGSGLDAGGLHGAVVSALDEIERIDGVLSDWREDTDLSRFNHSPTSEAVPLGADFDGWLADARHWSRATDGAFDPAVGALVAAWKLRTGTPNRPNAASLAAARSASGLALIETHDGQAQRRHADVLLDPGASGKGYALDRAALILADHGIRHALISFRSTMLALGPPPGASSWSIPIVHDGPGEEVARVELHRGALSVSGGSMRAFDDNGVSRGHVIDPRTGVPVPAERLAWVRYDTASGSDALATALLVDGPHLKAPAGASGGFLPQAGALCDVWP